MEKESGIGREMARTRKKMGLIQAELGQAVGVSQRMIAAIERGERRPSPELAQRIGVELGFAWTKFFEETGGDGAGGTEGADPGAEERTGTEGSI